MNPLPVPVPWVLLLLAVAFALLRCAHLRWRDHQRTPARDALRLQLQQLHKALVPPGSDAEPPAAADDIPMGWCYRIVPAPTTDRPTDRRLLLLHEDAPRQRLPRFPGEEPARTVMFADGRIEWFTESAFDRLLVGDNVLRRRLRLPEIDVHGREED